MQVKARSSFNTFILTLSSCLVIIPTYNEIENVEDIIQAVLRQGQEFNLLIVDDGSPDGTADKVIGMKNTEPRIHLIQRPSKMGLGTAYITGFRYGIEQGFEYIFEMDADFSHNPDDLPRLLNAVKNEGYDLAIGSRYTQGGDISNWPADRKLLSYAASMYVRMITWMPVMDPTAGFICYSKKVLESMDLNKITFVGYAFQIEMKYYAWVKGFKIKEVPIIFSDRLKGKSKMNSNIISEAIRGVLEMKFRSLKGYYK